MTRTVVLKRAAARPERRIPRRPAGAPAPLSFGQEQLWLHGELAPGALLYAESLTIHYHGRLRPKLVVACFDEIVRRHDMWRTTLAWSDRQLVQVAHPGREPRLRVADLRHLPAGDRESAALRLAEEDLRRPFDLFREPGVRARLVTVSDCDHRLYLGLHHLVFDGISIYRVFLPELAELYAAGVRGTPCALEEPPLQYADFASWQRRTVDEAAMDRLAEYWRAQLSGAPSLTELAGQRRRPSRQSFRGGLVRLDLPAELTSAVRSAALAEGCTLFMVLLASFAATLHRWSGQTELMIGSVSGGRDRPELERVIGYFLRMLVIRVDLHGDPTFRELLRRVRETLLDALCHDGLPFQRLIRALAPPRDLGRSPLFQVTFSIEPPMPQLGPEWEITEMDAGAVASKFDLSLELEDKGERMHVRAIYSLDLFQASGIRRLLEDWRGLLGRALADPERRLRELARPDELAGTSGRGERP